MDKQFIKQKFNELFWFYEKNKFINEGSWSYDANLVFSFCDWIVSLSNEDLAEYLNIECNNKIKKYRKELILGCDKWIMDNIKNIF